MFFRKSIRIADLAARVERFPGLYFETLARYNASAGANNILREKVKCAQAGQSAADKQLAALKADFEKAHGYNQSMDRHCKELETVLVRKQQSIDFLRESVRTLQYQIANPSIVREPGPTIPEHVQPWTMERPTEYIYTQSVEGK